MPEYTYTDIAQMIDHSLLRPTMADDDLETGCRLAKDYQVASVCIKPYAVAAANRILSETDVTVGTTIGFPHGGHTTTMKVAECKEAIVHGATELDMVVNIGKVLGGDWKYVHWDIEAVVNAAHASGAIVKVIFENSFLQDEHKKMLCRICGDAGADFVKTATGYGDGGATDTDLILMREFSPPHVRIKAAGGVRTLDRLLEIRNLGVARVGATATRTILDECRLRLN